MRQTFHLNLDGTVHTMEIDLHPDMNENDIFDALLTRFEEVHAPDDDDAIAEADEAYQRLHDESDIDTPTWMCWS